MAAIRTMSTLDLKEGTTGGGVCVCPATFPSHLIPIASTKIVATLMSLPRIIGCFLSKVVAMYLST
jgi:hypothetical protein